MVIKAGDRVSFIDEAGEGVVRAVKGELLLIEKEDGFDYWVPAGTVIKRQPLNISRVVQKDRPERNKPEGGKKKDRGIVEVDLHIHELTEFSGRLSNFEMLRLQLETAEKAIEKARRSFVKKVILIHGVGKGRLREELHEMLNGMERLSYHDASFTKYGAGATEVELW